MVLKLLRTRSCLWDPCWASWHVCLGEGATCWTGDGGTPPLHALSTARGSQTVAGFGQQRMNLPLGWDGDSEGCLNHRGFPWARQDLGTWPCRMSGQGGWMGKELLAPWTHSPGAISLLKDLTPVEWPQVGKRTEVTRYLSYDFSYFVSFLSGSVFGSAGLQTTAAPLQSLQ